MGCKKVFFFRNYAENKTVILVPDLILSLKNALYKVKANKWWP